MTQESHERHFKTNAMRQEYFRDLVVTRLQAMPPNISVSIGDHGDFSKNDLIREVREGSDVGKAAIEIEMTFLRNMPRLAQSL